MTVSVSVFVLVGFCTLSPSLQSVPDNCKTLYLLNLVPYPDNRTSAGWDKGLELIPAGHLAARHINGNPDILPSHKLEVLDVQSEACGINLVIEGVTEYYQHLLSGAINPMCVLGVVGLFCSTVTDTIAPHLNHPKLGYVHIAASSSPQHRNTTNLPYTFHSIVSSSVFNEAMLALMKERSWNKINIVYGSEGIFFRTTGTDFVELIKSQLGNASYSILEIPEEKSLTGLFELINKEETRIGYFTITNSATANILCEAYQRKFLERYTFILHTRSLPEIFNASVSATCTKDVLTKALESTYLLHYKLKPSHDNDTIVSGITYVEYRTQFIQELHMSNEANLSLNTENIYANSLYDQVWALALAANKAMDKLRFLNTTRINVSDITSNRDVLREALKGVVFNGSSGLIRFGVNQEAQTQVDIYQVKDGEQVRIGMYDSLQGMVEFEANFDTQSLPGDSFGLRYSLLPLWLGSLVLVCSAILVLLTLFNTVAMLVLRRRPEIKSTSVYLSLIILTGCFFLLSSPILLTVQRMFHIASPAAYLTLCLLEFWLFVDGIYIILVTLLIRLLRIFRVFRAHHSTGKYWSDKYLLLYIALIFTPMLLLNIIKAVVDPFYLDNSSKTFMSTARPPYVLLVSKCSSNSLDTWVALASLLVGVVMVAVIFLAIQTRHIKRKHFKDTKKVNMFIFSVCINYAVFISMWFILLAVGLDIGAYLFQCIANIMGAALCQMLLFLPKTLPAIRTTYTGTTPPFALQRTETYYSEYR